MLQKVITSIFAVLVLAGCTSSAVDGKSKYKFKDISLCLDKEPIYTRDSHDGSAIGILETVIDDIPVRVTSTYDGNYEGDRSVLITITSPEQAHIMTDKYLNVVKNNLSSIDKRMIHREGDLYRVNEKSNSALDSYDYFKVDPLSINKDDIDLKKLSELYLGLCVDGINREDSCSLNYYYKGLVLDYKINQSAIRDWQIVVSSVNKKIDKWMGCKSK